MEGFPKTITYSGKRLLEMKDGADLTSPIFQALKSRADTLLDCPVLSVVHRKLRAASGNIHDYMSMGPYWWPDPNKPNGLPYIRRDGEINPETKDDVTFSRLAGNVHTLALAAFYFNDERYAKKAETMLYDWFISEETYMTPHLTYGQSIPGICTGRGIGLIDFSGSYNIFDAVKILEFCQMIAPETVNSLKKWFTEFVNWMLTSEIGIDEDDQHNNHGAWFDVQVASAAFFTDRPILARKTLKSAFDRRVKKHIMDDGSQPHELARTKAMHYSHYNLTALLLLGRMARVNGIKAPYFDETEERTCLLRRAVDYLYPYVKEPSSFPYTELSSKPPYESTVSALLTVYEVFGEPAYLERAEEFATDTMLCKSHPQA